MVRPPIAWWTRSSSSPRNWQSRRPTPKSRLSPSNSFCISAKKVSANGFKAGNLHHYWDTEFVALLETDAKSIASDLIGHISKEQQRKWQPGSPSDWAVETFEVAKADAYGQLPEPSARNTYQLTDEYVTTATDDVALQLSKAGVRLAFLLNKALRKQ